MRAGSTFPRLVKGTGEKDETKDKNRHFRVFGGSFMIGFDDIGDQQSNSVLMILRHPVIMTGRQDFVVLFPCFFLTYYFLLFI